MVVDDVDVIYSGVFLTYLFFFCSKNGYLEFAHVCCETIGLLLSPVSFMIRVLINVLFQH